MSIVHDNANCARADRILCLSLCFSCERTFNKALGGFPSIGRSVDRNIQPRYAWTHKTRFTRHVEIVIPATDADMVDDPHERHLIRGRIIPQDLSSRISPKSQKNNPVLPRSLPSGPQEGCLEVISGICGHGTRSERVARLVVLCAFMWSPLYSTHQCLLLIDEGDWDFQVLDIVRKRV